MRLDRKVTVITGAGTGLGQAAALLFASEGARLALIDPDADALSRLGSKLEEDSPAFLDLVADISRGEDCRRIIDKTMARFGRLDVLLNSVESARKAATPSQYEEELASYLQSMDLLCAGATPVMAAQGGGSIIHTILADGSDGPTAIPAGLLDWTRRRARDHVRDGIRVNGICPAGVDTPSLRQRLQGAPDLERAWRTALARIPMGRLGRAEEIAALALFLASDESGFMTGQTLVMDGGMTL